MADPSHLDESQHAQLTGPRLESLGAGLLKYYLRDAYYFEPNENVGFFKRCLPRICEVVAFEHQERFPDVEIWLVLSHLASQRCREWPVTEREAVDHYWRSLWLQALSAGFGELHFGRADEVFLGMPFLYADLQFFLTEWREQTRRSISGALGLAHLLGRNSGFFRAGEQFGLNWPEGGIVQVSDWLRDPELLRSMSFWLDRYAPEDEVRWRLRDAVELLGIYRDKH
ncbi:MAG: hypothetical protein ACQEVA_22630 [Myxococcota bacterium]